VHQQEDTVIGKKPRKGAGREEEGGGEGGGGGGPTKRTHTTTSIEEANKVLQYLDDAENDNRLPHHLLSTKKEMAPLLLRLAWLIKEEIITPPRLHHVPSHTLDEGPCPEEYNQDSSGLKEKTDPNKLSHRLLPDRKHRVGNRIADETMKGPDDANREDTYYAGLPPLTWVERT